MIATGAKSSKNGGVVVNETMDFSLPNVYFDDSAATDAVPFATDPSMPTLFDESAAVIVAPNQQPKCETNRSAMKKTKTTKRKLPQSSATQHSSPSATPASSSRKRKASSIQSLTQKTAAAVTCPNGGQQCVHSFIQLINCYNLLPVEAQKLNAESIRALRSNDEANLCTGDTLSRRSYDDQLQLLCQGINVNLECVKRHLVRNTEVGDFFCIDELTDKLTLRYAHLWYDFATSTDCALKSLKIADLVQLLSTNGTTMRVDDRLGRMCRICVEYFLRFNNVGKLCPKLYSSATLSQPKATTSKVKKNDVQSTTANIAVTAAKPIPMPRLGLGAARKKIVAPPDISLQQNVDTSLNDKRSADPSTAMSSAAIQPAAAVVPYMSDYDISSEEDDDSDYDAMDVAPINEKKK